MNIYDVIKRRAGRRWHQVQARAADMYNDQYSGLWPYENCLERAYICVCKGGK